MHADAGMQIARRVGLLRETNFGQTFEVANQPDPNNLAYTAIELPLHTDLPSAQASAWYRAYRAFMRLTRNPSFRLVLQTRPRRNGGLRQTPHPPRPQSLQPRQRLAPPARLLRGSRGV
jgi:hypothetical protein